MGGVSPREMGIPGWQPKEQPYAQRQAEVAALPNDYAPRSYPGMTPVYRGAGPMRQFASSNAEVRNPYAPERASNPDEPPRSAPMSQSYAYGGSVGAGAGSVPNSSQFMQFLYDAMAGR